MTAPDPRLLRHALALSVASIAWTVVAGVIQVVVGIRSHLLALVVLGAAGGLDAIASAALVVHLRHGQRHDELADHHERRATLAVSIGLVILGVVTLVQSGLRFASGDHADETDVGTAIALGALVLLPLLATGKIRVGRALGTPALVADGWLSASGAVLAGIAAVSALTASVESLWWVDPTAASVIAVGAATYGSIVLRREALNGGARASSHP